MAGSLVFEYDELGRLTRVLDLESQIETTYDYYAEHLAPEIASRLEEGPGSDGVGRAEDGRAVSQ